QHHLPSLSGDRRRAPESDRHTQKTAFRLREHGAPHGDHSLRLQGRRAVPASRTVERRSARRQERGRMKTVSQIKGESNVPVVAADHKGLVTEVNERFTSVFGWSREEIVGKPLASIIPTKLRDTHRLGFPRFLRTGRA